MIVNLFKYRALFLAIYAESRKQTAKNAKNRQTINYQGLYRKAFNLHRWNTKNCPQYCYIKPQKILWYGCKKNEIKNYTRISNYTSKTVHEFTMNLNSFTQTLTDKIKMLSSWKKLIFLTAIAQRSEPNWQLFAQLTINTHTHKYTFGLQPALDLLWQHPLTQISQKKLSDWLDKIETLTPDPAKYHIYGVYPALSAASEVQLALQYAISPSEEKIFQAIALNLNTISRFIKTTEAEQLSGTELFQYVIEHPLLLSYTFYAEELISQLQINQKAHPKLIKELRTLAYNDGFSQLGISVLSE